MGGWGHYFPFFVTGGGKKLGLFKYITMFIPSDGDGDEDALTTKGRRGPVEYFLLLPQRYTWALLRGEEVRRGGQRGGGQRGGSYEEVCGLLEGTLDTSTLVGV